MWFIYSFYLGLLALVGAAFIWGGRPERVASLLQVLAALGSFGVRYALGNWSGLQGSLLVIDAALLFAFLLLGIRTGHHWLIVSASFQTISTLAHLAKAMDASWSGVAYSLMEGASSYPTLILLAFGIWWHPAQRLFPVRNTLSTSSATDRKV